jgi:CBS-domain-containing membrane protein
VTCATIMTRQPVTVAQTASIGEGAALILTHGYINLPVVDGENRLVGLFGVYDLLALLVPRIAMVGDLVPNLRFLNDDMAELRENYRTVSGSPIRTAMNREPVTVHPETPIIEAIRLLCRNHMTIPVVTRDTGEVCGMISYWDAARAVVDGA